MALYKFTDSKMFTRPGHSNALLWGPNVTHCVEWGGALCGPGCLHAYRSPAIAEMMDPEHGGYGEDALLWRAEGEVLADDGSKVGCAKLTTVEVVERVIPTTEQRVRFAIAAAWQNAKNADWRKWARDWLTGTDRSYEAAAAAAREAAWEAAWAAAAAAAAAARATAWAAAAAAARATAWAEYRLDLVVCADWAMTDSVDIPDVRRHEQAASGGTT